MTNRELARQLAYDHGITYKLANEIIDSIIQKTMKAVKDKKEMQFIGFGKFVPFLRHAREGVNPRNPKERIHMDEVLTVKFRAGKTFKDYLKK